MKLYMISWQEGFGIASVIFLSKERAELKKEEIRKHIEETLKEEPTTTNYYFPNSLTLKEITTEDEITCSICEYLPKERKS